MAAITRRKPRVSEEIIGPDEYNDHVVAKPVSGHTIEVIYLTLVLIAIAAMALMTLEVVHALGVVTLAILVFAYRMVRINRVS